MTQFVPSPARPAPLSEGGLVAWLRKNLFSSIPNSIVSLIAIWFAFKAVTSIFGWAIWNADWVGTSRDDCTSGGACWVFVATRLQTFLYGFYPADELWRPNTVFLTLVALVVWMNIPKAPFKKWVVIGTLTVYPVVSFILLYGNSFGLPQVQTSSWGGLTLTLVIAVVGVVLALPIGIVLALGRRSDMPIVRFVSTIFIEFWRGVPLITVLFMASVMLPLFFSGGTSIDRLLRALIGITLFQAAYIAEVVRGGLQAIPKGQYEAADALGLSYWQKTNLIVLPQALKITIPSLVGTLISLFKDTTLVLIIGLQDVLAMVRQGLADPAWLGFPAEGYAFAGLMFWIFCFGMSRYSLYLERRLNTGHKN
ncbi:amino acid ABC transporter permease [Salinispirillum marinum]|uniref:Amino acid ABC transporter permease n=2 Tax=Saccharospirillaceae TaxID=255527 RepID=A0ABV8BFF8_9GAMM